MFASYVRLFYVRKNYAERFNLIIVAADFPFIKVQRLNPAGYERLSFSI